MTESHLKVLQLLAENPALTQRAISDELNLSIGKVNHIISTLVEKSFIKRIKNPDGKFSYMHFLTSSGFKKKMELAHIFLRKKSEEHATLGKDIEEIKKYIKSFMPHEEENHDSEDLPGL